MEMTRICAVAAASEPGELASRGHAALAAGADLVELRLDHLRPLTVATLEAALGAARGRGLMAGGRLVLSLRAKRDSGAFEGDEDLRRPLLAAMASAGAAWVDLEGWLPPDAMRDLTSKAHAKGSMTLVSWHLGGKDAHLRARELAAVQAASGAAGNAVKMVLPVDDRASLDALIGLSNSLAEGGVPHVVLPSGRLGRLGRLLAPLTGTEWVYAEPPVPEAKGVSGPLGLPIATDLADAWRQMGTHPALEVGAMVPPPMVPGDEAERWTLLAILGDPIGHTLSPAMHHAAMAGVGLHGAYVPLRTPSGSVPRSLEELEAAGAVGCNVTVPVKVEAAKQMGRLGEAARRSGAVNTVVLDGKGGRLGENTDVVGVGRAAEELLGPRGTGRTALVLGTGGSARGAAVGLAGWGASVLATGRDPSRLERMVADLDGLAEGVDAGKLASVQGGVDLLVQCTTQGMRDLPPTGPLAPLRVVEAVRPRSVLDLVYAPGGTELVRWAKREGLPAAGGERVLLHQAAASFALWTGLEAPLAAMEAALGAASRPVVPGWDPPPSSD
jgi:shikimate dehydrogenase